MNASHLDDGVPRSVDLPPIEVQFVGGADARGPFGATGLAEIALSPTALAVAHAAAHAIGHKFGCLPLSLDVVLSRLVESGQVPAPLSRPAWQKPSRWWVAAIRWSCPRGLHLMMRALTALAHERPGARARRHRRVVAPAVEVVPTLDALVRTLEFDPHAPRSGDGLGATLAELRDFCATGDPPALGMFVEVIDSIASPQVRNVATVAAIWLRATRPTGSSLPRRDGRAPVPDRDTLEPLRCPVGARRTPRGAQCCRRADDQG